jgi:hypothetical protein
LCIHAAAAPKPIRRLCRGRQELEEAQPTQPKTRKEKKGARSEDGGRNEKKRREEAKKGTRIKKKTRVE